MKNLIVFILFFTVNSFVLANERIEQVLNNFHQAAANADAKTYFNLLTKDSVFLGTDATERWTKEEFKSFVIPYFEKGVGWAYTPTKRNITISHEGDVAFFDELLANESYGTCRGSGVLFKTAKGWRIAQYNLSIPLPNALAKEITSTISQHEIAVKAELKK